MACVSSSMLLNACRSINGGNFKHISFTLRNAITLGFQRHLHKSFCLRDIFNVQDKDDFKERVLDSATPVVVDFHATWCGPCKFLGPRLESVLTAYNGKVHLAKVDVDENTDLALDYDVSAVPLVLGIKNGKVVDKFTGLIDEDEIKSFVDKLVIQ